MKPKIRRPVNCLKLSHSAIINRFSDSLGSFQPNRHLVAVGHGCARTPKIKSRMCPTAVNFVSVLQIREFMSQRALCLYICYITDKGMLVKEITQFRDHSIWILDTPIRQIYIEARHYTLNFTRIQCAKRNIWDLPTSLFLPVDRDNVVILLVSLRSW